MQNESTFKLGEEGRELSVTIRTPPLLKSVREDEKGNYK